MTQKSNKFYPLGNEEWLELCNLLTHSELKVLFYLRTLEPFGDCYRENSTADLAKALNISQRSVQRALLKLKELDLIELEITKFKFRVKSQVATPTSLGDTHDATATPMSRPRHQCRDDDTHVATATPMSPSQLETLSEQASQTSHTIQTYSDLIQTLSEGEREKFENFVSKEYGKPIDSFPAFMHGEHFAHWWGKYACVSDTVTNWRSHPKFDECIAYLRENPFQKFILVGEILPRKQREQFVEWAQTEGLLEVAA